MDQVRVWAAAEQRAGQEADEQVDSSEATFMGLHVGEALGELCRARVRRPLAGEEGVLAAV